VAHISRKKYRCVSVWGLALQALLQTSPDTRQELSGDGVRGGASAENGFSVIWYPQIASDNSKCFTCVLKNGWYGTPQSKKWGYWYPSYVTPMSKCFTCVLKSGGYGTPCPKVGCWYPWYVTPMGLQTSNLVHRRRPASATSAVTSKVKVTWCVWQVLADKSRTKRPSKTKIGRKIVHPTHNNAPQIQGHS